MAASQSPSSLEEMLPRQFGKYTLLRAIAAGGMAKVYLAIQRAVAGFEKLVVIKRILPELSQDPAFVEMLLIEARTAATLNHPNIVQTFDVGEVENTYYIAMEHINGEDIRSIVRAMKRAQVTEFPLEHTLSIILGMCAGLSYAHEKKDLEGNSLHIVHRDISPQNVLITFTGDVKVVDFGIAKTSEVAVGERTQAGQLKGKVPYMSPEQCQSSLVDRRSDLFSLGIVLYEMTTVTRLFYGDNEFATMNRIVTKDVEPPSTRIEGYPAKLEEVVLQALRRDPAERFQSGLDFQLALEQAARELNLVGSPRELGAFVAEVCGREPLPLLDPGPTRVTTGGPPSLSTGVGRGAVVQRGGMTEETVIDTVEEMAASRRSQTLGLVLAAGVGMLGLAGIGGYVVARGGILDAEPTTAPAQVGPATDEAEPDPPAPTPEPAADSAPAPAPEPSPIPAPWVEPAPDAPIPGEEPTMPGPESGEGPSAPTAPEDAAPIADVTDPPTKPTTKRGGKTGGRKSGGKKPKSSEPTSSDAPKAGELKPRKRGGGLGSVGDKIEDVRPMNE
jgi:serine/threonine-protein kinase